MFACAAVAQAVTYVVPTDREMVRRSDAIVVASAVNSYTQLTDDGGVETVTSMIVQEVIAGPADMAQFEIREPGGVFGDRASLIPGMPRFDAGQPVVVLLKHTPRNTWAVADFALGKFALVTDSLGRKLAVRDEGELVGWDVDGTPHVERPRLAKAFLDFLRAESHGKVGRDDYFVTRAPLSVAADSTAPKLKPAPTSFTGTNYTAAFGGGQGGRWPGFPSAVTFGIQGTEPGAPGSPAGSTAVQAALSAWSNRAGSNVNYTYTSTAITGDNGVYGAADGKNAVLFEVNLTGHGVNAFSCSSGGVLGVGGVTSAGGSNSLNGETFFSIFEGDVDMNQGIANCTSLFSSGDFNTAVTHEIGHTLGFRHSDQTRADDPNTPCTTDPTLDCSSAAIMKAVIVNGINGALQAWDLRAVQALYPAPGSCIPSSISQQPTGSTISSGGSTSLTVGASGTAPFTYQWYIGASGVTTTLAPNGTSATLNLTNVTQTNSYWCRVTNGCGSADSNAATVTVSGPCNAPQITTQPVGGNVNQGGSTSLSVAASGTTPLTYQWYVGPSGTTTTPAFNGTGQTLVLSNVTGSNQYWCQVSNACGSANSNAATVTAVCNAPVITLDVADQQVTSGNTVILTVGYGGTQGTVTWYQGVKPDKSHPAGTGQSISAGPITQTTQFWAEVVNGCGSAQTRTATITVTVSCIAPNIASADASSHSVSAGTTINLTVQASGSSLQYQWYRGQPTDTSNPLPNGNAALATDAPSATTTYWVRVSNSCGHADSAAITVTVGNGGGPPPCDPVAITSLTPSSTISSNGTVTLTVTATGGTTRHFAWFQGTAGDKSKPVGTDSPAFKTAALFSTTSFWVQVTNDCGNSTNSSTVTLTVIPAKHRATRH